MNSLYTCVSGCTFGYISDYSVSFMAPLIKYGMGAASLGWRSNIFGSHLGDQQLLTSRGWGEVKFVFHISLSYLLVMVYLQMNSCANLVLGGGSTLFGPLWGVKTYMGSSWCGGPHNFMHLIELFASPHPILSEWPLASRHTIIE